MKVVGVIPARFGSSRFEGKPLKLIAGKPLLQRVIEGALKASSLQELIVATDHHEIADLARSCGVRAVMTESDLPSGSDRVWAAVEKLDCDLVLNIQGDEPLLEATALEQLVQGFSNREIQMVTLARIIRAQQELENPNVAKVVTDREGIAIYFSRLPIPHCRKRDLPAGSFVCLKHVGLYGYTKAFLKRFCAQAPTPLELAEGLEQLRALWLGARIKVILTECDSWGVDTPEDVIRVENILKQRRE